MHRIGVSDFANLLQFSFHLFISFRLLFPCSCVCVCVYMRYCLVSLIFHFLNLILFFLCLLSFFCLCFLFVPFEIYEFPPSPSPSPATFFFSFFSFPIARIRLLSCPRDWLVAYSFRMPSCNPHFRSRIGVVPTFCASSMCACVCVCRVISCS